MVGPDYEVRITRIEGHVEGLDQRVTKLDSRVDRLVETPTKVAVLAERMGSLHTAFGEFRTQIADRDDEARQERRAYIRWAITLTVTIICALIGALTVILSSGGHP